MDYLETFNELKSTLLELDLKWIVDEVEQEIETGKFVEEKHSTLKETGKDIAGSRFSRGQKVDFTKRIDYEPKEKLLLLLDGLSNGAIEPVKIEGAISKWLGEDIHSFEFVAEEVDDDERNTSRLRADNQVIDNLKQEIDNLKMELVSKND